MLDTLAGIQHIEDLDTEILAVSKEVVDLSLCIGVALNSSAIWRGGVHMIHDAEGRVGTPNGSPSVA
jgi:hypothetical protein